MYNFYLYNKLDFLQQPIENFSKMPVFLDYLFDF